MTSPEELWAEVSKTYTIHPETLALTASKEHDLKQISQAAAGDIEAVREKLLQAHLAANGENPKFDGTTEEIDAGGVPATVYVPASRPAENPAVMVYFHGGSLMMQSRRTHDASVKAVSERAGVVVVSVEYRLLPQPDDPMAPFNDAVTATRWVMRHREQLPGVSGPGVKVGVGGDSAGGQLALGVTHEIRSGLDFMVLVYPTADMNTDLPSCREFDTTPVFNGAALRTRFAQTNAAIPDAEKNPLLNAAFRTDLSSSPPAVVVLAQLDPLRDAGATFARRLKDAGVLVRQHLIEGVPHGFFSLPGVFPSNTDKAFKHIADFLRKFY